MKRLLVAGLLFFVGFCVFNAVQKSGSTQKPATTINAWEQPSKDAPTSNAPEPMKVSAMKLFVDYHRNEVAADNVYKGRLLAVEGTVVSINKDFLDKAYVELAALNEFENVQAHLDDGNQSSAAALQRGETVSLLCTGGGMVIGSPMLEKCSFYHPPDKTVAIANTPPIAVEEKPFAARQSTQHDDESAPVVSSASNSSLSQAVGVGVNDVHKIGGTVSAPILIYSAEPEFPDNARKDKVGCHVMVNMWVGTDGLPSHLRVIQEIYVDQNGHASSGPQSTGAGFGFDEKALDAVRQYKFKPAMQNGAPVLVELNVEVNFQLL
jgi:tRNA_anti-like/Gram-negative bacterial TonB protein C-terminal